MSKVLKNYVLAVTSPYGQRSSGFHGGIDLVGNNNGTHVLDYIVAIEKGTVTNLRKDCQGFEDNGSYGNFVHIDHLNGLSTVYAHLSPNSICVEKGQAVEKGQVIGFMGNTGHSFGGHLHFEVRLWNERIDPSEYVLSDKKIIEEPKIVITEPAEENKEVNQVYITCDNTMRCRTNCEIIDNVIGFYKQGFYNILEEKSTDFHWCKVAENNWVAILDGYANYIPKYEEPVIEIKPIEEPKLEDSPIAQEDSKPLQNEQEEEKIEDNSIDIINNDKKNPLIEFLKWFFNEIMKLMKGGK